MLEHISVTEAHKLTVGLDFYNLFAEDLRIADPYSQSHTTKTVKLIVYNVWAESGETKENCSPQFCATKW